MPNQIPETDLLAPFLQTEAPAPEEPEDAEPDYVCECCSDGMSVDEAQGDHTPRPLLQSKANEHLAAITQDGRYMAYVSDQSGRDEIWVSSFPEVQGAQQVSTEGGTGPLYAPDGKTLYYRDAAATRLFAVPVTWQPGPPFGAPMVTNGWWVNDYPWVRQYDITPHWKRFVMIVGTSPAGNEITVVQNWLEEVKRLVPVK